MLRTIIKPWLRGGTLALFVGITGCASLPKPADDGALQREAMAGTQNPVPAPLPLNNDINDNASSPTASSTINHGSGQFIHPTALSKPRPAASGPGTVSFNFENQPVQAVVKAILGDLLKQNYTIVPGVQGNISFATSEEVDASQALPILETLLSWTHNALIQRNGGYVVVPEKDAVSGNLVPSMGAIAPKAGMQARLFPLHYISATEMEKLLKPFARPDAVLLANPSRNLLVVSGTPDELANYQNMVRTFDVDWLRGMSVGVFNLQYANVTELMPKLDGMFGPHGDTPLAGMLRFIPIERTNAMVVISTQPQYLQEVGEWITTIDRGGGNQPQLFVYDVRNLKASDLAKYLAQIYTNGSGNNNSDSGGKVGPGLNGATLGSADNSSANSMGSTAGSFGNSSSFGSNGSSGSSGSLGANGSSGLGSGSGIGGSSSFGNSTDSRDGSGTSSFGSNGSGAGGSATSGSNGASNDQQYSSSDGSVKISSVDANNQLLVRARPAQWEEMKTAIHKLDNVPLQVQIETRILEVSLTGEFQFGVQWYLEGLTGSTTNATGGIVPGQPYRHRQVALGGNNSGGLNTNFTGQPFFYSFLNSQMQVAVSALETNGNAKTLSAPSMVVMNNQVGTIQVGDSIPINSTSVNATVGATTSLNEVSYINTGVILNVLPRINPGGLVYMNISQEVSQVDKSTGAIASNGNPSIQQRKLATQVAVQSGQTVLLGGLIQQQDTNADTGLPGLNRVPILGRLFGNTDRSRNRTELIVLITPRIIRGSEDAKQITDDYQNKFESLEPLRTSAKPSLLKKLSNFEPPPTLTAPSPAPITAAPSWPEQLQAHAESALQQGDTTTALDMATQSWKQGSRRGDLCARNWQTIGAVRKSRGDVRGANAASKQQNACLAPAAPQ